MSWVGLCFVVVMCLWPWTGGFEWGHVRKSEERNLRWLCGWGAVLAASSEAAPLNKSLAPFSRVGCRVSRAPTAVSAVVVPCGRCVERSCVNVYVGCLRAIKKAVQNFILNTS